MRSVRVTRKDGFAWSVALDLERLNVGRDADNEVVLPDPAVSRRHCLIERIGDEVVVKDRGTSNGTFVNNEYLNEPRVLREGDRVYVGPYLLELVSIVAPASPTQIPQRPHGPVLRVAEGNARDGRHVERLCRWAQEWDEERRPARLLLRGRLLSEARQTVRAGLDQPIVQAFVARSGRRQALRRLGLGGALILGMALAATITWISWPSDEDGHDDEPIAAADGDDSSLGPAPKLGSSPAPPPRAPQTWVEHVVVPAESIEDIARRYGVTVSNVARWNGLNADAPDFVPGQTLRVNAFEVPLPQQQIEFELDRDYDWKSLSERFDVEVEKLRAYNPEIETLDKGLVVDVWINPKPYGRRTELLDLPQFEIKQGALSVGAPNEGALKNGIKMPPSPLYVRRYPNIMWGSTHTIQTLLTAVARFRQDLAFDHELVLADISRKNGGRFRPHKSHQAGRDIDIWMPTLKGVYKKSYLGTKTKDRKPRSNEVDWFATWGLVRALIDTDQVVNIFLDYPLQEYLYKAAKEMGASDEELRASIQWPRGKSAGAKVGHSAGHVGHIHVRFKCAPNDIDCRDRPTRNAPDDQ